MSRPLSVREDAERLHSISANRRAFERASRVMLWFAIAVILSVAVGGIAAWESY